MKKFMIELDMVPVIEHLMSLYCDNTRAIAQAKESRSYHKSKDILKYFYLIYEIVERHNMIIEWVDTKNNIVDLFIKSLS